MEPPTRLNPQRVLENIDNSLCNKTCAGRKKNGQRCLNCVTAANRNRAAILVTKMSRPNISSRQITELLQALAPLVLCQRWHQDQAANMIDNWQRQPDALRRRRRAATRAREEERRVEEEERREESRLRRAEERRVQEAVQQAEQARRQQEAVQQANVAQQAQEAAPVPGEASSEQAAINQIEIQQLRAELDLIYIRLEEVEDRNRDLQRRIHSDYSESQSSRAVDQDVASEADVLTAVPILSPSTSVQHVAEGPVSQVPTLVEREEEDPTSPTITPSDFLPEEPEDLDNQIMEERPVSLITTLVEYREEDPISPTITLSDFLPEEPEDLDDQVIEEISTSLISTPVERREEDPTLPAIIPNNYLPHTSLFHRLINSVLMFVSLITTLVKHGEEDPTLPTITPNAHLLEESEDLDNRVIEENCCICLESLGSENELTRCRAQCGLRFHRDCISNRLTSTDDAYACPHCRADWRD